LNRVKKKLEALATHNKNNKQSLSAASNTPEWGIIPLTVAEIKAITNRIKFDNNASGFLRGKYGSSGQIKGVIYSKSAILIYLRYISERK
jgi:hypothetical protein